MDQCLENIAIYRRDIHIIGVVLVYFIIRSLAYKEGIRYLVMVGLWLPGNTSVSIREVRLLYTLGPPMQLILGLVTLRGQERKTVLPFTAVYCA